MFEESWITKFDVKANIFLVYQVVLKVSNAQSQHYKCTFAKKDIITAYMTQANKCLVGKKKELLSAIIKPLPCNLQSARWLKTDCNDWSMFSIERQKAKANSTSIPKLCMVQEIA